MALSDTCSDLLGSLDKAEDAEAIRTLVEQFRRDVREHQKDPTYGRECLALELLAVRAMASRGKDTHLLRAFAATVQQFYDTTPGAPPERGRKIAMDDWTQHILAGAAEQL